MLGVADEVVQAALFVPQIPHSIRHVGSRNPALLGLGRVLVWGLRRQADVSVN
jgi:hypothetical protein